jgi:DNA-binding HxlR family transcriptional regulator
MTKMARQPVLRVAALQARDAIELLAEKWRIVIVHLLRNGPLRTHELQEAIEAISPKMLTQTLRGMERDGLVTRVVYAVAPSRVEYELTAMGRSVIEPLETLCRWANAHVAERDSARARFELALSRSGETKKRT